jgi:hypothetical protein
MNYRWVFFLPFGILFFSSVFALEQWDSSKTNSVSNYVCNAKENTDNTVGCEAFNDIGLNPNTRNIDIGGGKYDDNTNYLKRKYHVENVVYDPYNRSKEENKKALLLAKQKPFDSATSMSVLNVISSKKELMAHIQLMFNCIHSGGTAYFKIYAGNKTGKPYYRKGIFQSNRGAKSYFSDVEKVFGKGHVTLFEAKNLIVANKF